MATVQNGALERVPLTIPVSDLRNEQAKILGQLHDGPILLTQRGRAAAMLVEPALWNLLIDRLSDLEDIVNGLDAYHEYQQDPASARPLGELENELLEMPAAQESAAYA